MRLRRDEKVDWSSGARLFLLHRTPLGFIYRKFMKPYRHTRQLAIWCWVRMFPMFVTLYQALSFNAQKLPLRSLRSVGGAVTSVADEERVITPAPEIHPSALRSLCPSPHGAYDFPAIYVAELSDCFVYGASNFFIHQGALVHHDLFRVEHDFTSEEMHGRFILRARRQKAYMYPVPSDVETIDEAALFTDALSFNYAHFISEVLPRIALFNKHGAPHVPLLLDAGLHANMMAAVRSVVGERDVILLEKGQCVHVGRTHVISNCGYVPFERRPGTSRLADHLQGRFSPLALESLRDAVLGRLNVDAQAARYLYIRRNSGYRNVLNAQEIEDGLVALGFEVVEPEKLSFAEQVEVFSGAKVVVGATGAAFANLVFCRADTRLVIMIARLENTSYYYWQNMACARGNAITYVFGTIQESIGQSIHSDFHVSLEDVIQALGSDVPPVPTFVLSRLVDGAEKVSEIHPAESIVTPVIEVQPLKGSALIVDGLASYQFPPIYLAQVTDCLVQGGSNFIFAGEKALHHDLYRFDHDYTSEELHKRISLEPALGVVCTKPVGIDVEYIEEAAVFTDALAPNYAHFMTEILPRVAMFNKHVPYAMPYLIDAGLHPNLMAALRMVIGEEQELKLLNQGRSIRIGRAHVISNCGYVPFERRAGSHILLDHSQGQFSPVAIRTMRDTVLGGLAAESREGRRLYIRRNSGYRNVLNSQEVEDSLAGQGFEVVEPEKLSFLEQVEVFSGASVVVGATGAAFANLLFCKPGTRLVIMIAELEGTSYNYWQNMACAAGNSVSYVLGTIKTTEDSSIHSDFEVSVRDVMEALAGSFPASCTDQALHQ